MIACVDAQALAAEVALGLVSGDERAAVLAHVDECDDCRQLVLEYSAVADALVVLAPNAEPSSGFERRVFDRIGARRRRWPVPVAAAAAVVLVVIGFAVGQAGNGPRTTVREVTMRTPTGREVGDVYVHGNDPTWVFVALPEWSDRSANYVLRVRLADGSSRDVRGGNLANGGGSWGTVLDVDSAQVRELTLIGDDGRVWCSATVSA